LVTSVLYACLQIERGKADQSLHGHASCHESR
jgi:hypothetical protein